MVSVMNRLPQHTMYVELFSGTKSRLLEKVCDNSEVYNDHNLDIKHFFEIVRKNPNEFKEFLVTGEKPVGDHIVQVDKWDRMKHLVDNFNTDLLKGSIDRQTGFKDISYDLKKELREFTSNIEYIIRRLRMVQYENRRFDDLIERFDTKETVFYIDITNLPEDVTKDEVAYRLLNVKGKGILYGRPEDHFPVLVDEGWILLEESDKEKMWINYRI